MVVMTISWRADDGQLGTAAQRRRDGTAALRTWRGCGALAPSTWTAPMNATIAVALLGPVLALVAWSLLVWAWMYATRVPAMRAARLRPDPRAPRGAQTATLPARVRWKADNYNHLMEQPTLFYALVISLALLGRGEPWVLA
jgi:hypothetical protein